MGFLEKKWPHVKMSVPQRFFQKMVQIGQKRHFFVFFSVEAPSSLRWGALCPRQICYSMQNYKHKWDVLEKMSDRPKYGGLISRLQGNGDRKLGDGISKKEAESCPSKIFNIIFGFKIYRRSWFSHQTWPNSMIWPSSGRSKLNMQTRQKGIMLPQAGL